ncbi:MAG TPA: hypothetical protein DCM14_02165 [Clostridiales bacterium UBA8153]|nr:hypothetical protein [Clostridiales bacterium UBA8153]
MLRGQLDGRGLELIQPLSRALRQGEIHELVVTTEGEAGPGRRVDSVGYLAFFEVQSGGLAVTGDPVSWGEHFWTLVGFDLTHAPNHLNLVVRGPSRLSGEELGMRVGDRLVIGGIP